MTKLTDSEYGSETTQSASLSTEFGGETVKSGGGLSTATSLTNSSLRTSSKSSPSTESSTFANSSAELNDPTRSSSWCWTRQQLGSGAFQLFTGLMPLPDLLMIRTFSSRLPSFSIALRILLLRKCYLDWVRVCGVFFQFAVFVSIISLIYGKNIKTLPFATINVLWGSFSSLIRPRKSYDELVEKV